MTGRDLGRPAWSADEDGVGQLPAGIFCTDLRTPTNMGSKHQKERKGGKEAGAGRVTGSTWTRAESRVADRVLVLRPGVKSEPLRWDSWVQDIGPPETSKLHVISISMISPRDLHLNAKTQLHSVIHKLQCWTPHTKQLAKQEHNPTH